MAKWFAGGIGFTIRRSLVQILHSTRYLDLFSVVPSSTPRPRCAEIIQLVSFPPVEILNSLCSICNIWLTYLAISKTVRNTFDLEIKIFIY